MRNLKRALSLALASVMLLGMMVVGTSAASYPDVDENDNVEAIEVLNAVSVMIGDRGNFRPDAAVNRHEMATIMAKLVLGVETADNYVGTHPFTDVFPWADKYVAACYENGLVAGTSATTFGGNQPLTAVQAAAMMLRALGYKDLSKGATDWRAPVTAMANQIRLFDGVASNPSEQLTRNQVAQLALNTLKSPMVNLKDNTISWSNDEGQIIMTGGSREYIALSSNEAYAKAINDTEKAGTSASQIAGFTVELGEHLYNGKLKLNNNYLDVFGRPARHWEFDGKEIGSYIKEELMVMDNVGEVTGNDLYSLLGASTIKDYDTLVTIDGVANDRSDAKDILGYPNGAYFDEADMNRNNKAAVGATGTGVLTQVFVDHEKDEVYVAVINTYLARADRDYDDKSEEATLTVYGIDEYRTEKEYVKLKGSSETMKVQAEDFTGLETIKKDDPFLVTVADGEIQTMAEDEVLEGVTLTAFKKGDHVVSDGTEYAYTTTATYDSATLDNYTGIDGKTNLKDISYNIYLDAYGNLIGIKEIDAVKNYVFLAGIDVDGSNLYSKTATANALFLDGTSKTIKINLSKSKFPTHRALNNTNVVISGDALLNTWCTYTVSSDNVYTVTEAYATRVNPDHPSFKDINANPNNYPGGGDNKTKLAQSWQPAAGLKEDNYTVDVKRMRLHGTTNNSDGSKYANVYGDSTSVYLTATLDELFNDSHSLNVDNTVNPVKPWSYGIIKDVDAVTTGVADVSIKVLEKKDARETANKNGDIDSQYPGATASGIYTLYDSDGIVIASVVVGEDDGAKDLVYVHTDTLDLESYNSTDDIWTWTRRVVFNGQETTLTEKDSELSELKEMLQFHWYEIKRNADGNVISVVPAYRALYNADTEKNAFVHEYEMINTTVEATSKDTVLYQTEDGPLPADDNGAVTGHAHYGFYKEKLDVIGTNTLAVETLSGSGIHFRDNVNVVLQYWNRNTEQTEIETGTGVDRLKSMVDFVNKNTETRDAAHPYYLSAVIEKGFATTIVIYDSFNSYNRPEASMGNYELTLGGVLNSIYTTPADMNSDVYIVNSDGSIDYVESNDSVATSTVNGYKRYTVPYNAKIRVYDNNVADADFQPFFSPIKALSDYHYYENTTAKRAYFEFTVDARLATDSLTIRERLSTDPVYVSIDSDAEATVTIGGTTYKPGQSFTVTVGQTITVVPTTAGDKVYVNGELLGADGKYTVKPTDTELVITTEAGTTPPDPEKNYYTVTFTGDNFTTDVAEQYEENTAVEVTITADEGYELVSVDGVATEAGAKTATWSTEKITANVTVEVVTKATTVTPPSTDAEGVYTAGGTEVELPDTVEAGKAINVTVTEMPADGWYKIIGGVLKLNDGAARAADQTLVFKYTPNADDVTAGSVTFTFSKFNATDADDTYVYTLGSKDGALTIISIPNLTVTSGRARAIDARPGRAQEGDYAELVIGEDVLTAMGFVDGDGDSRFYMSPEELDAFIDAFNALEPDPVTGFVDVTFTTSSVTTDGAANVTDNKITFDLGTPKTHGVKLPTEITVDGQVTAKVNWFYNGTAIDPESGDIFANEEDLSKYTYQVVEPAIVEGSGLEFPVTVVCPGREAWEVEIADAEALEKVAVKYDDIDTDNVVEEPTDTSGLKVVELNAANKWFANYDGNGEKWSEARIKFEVGQLMGGTVGDINTTTGAAVVTKADGTKVNIVFDITDGAVTQVANWKVFYNGETDKDILAWVPAEKTTAVGTFDGSKDVLLKLTKATLGKTFGTAETTFATKGLNITNPTADVYLYDAIKVAGNVLTGAKVVSHEDGTHTAELSSANAVMEGTEMMLTGGVGTADTYTQLAFTANDDGDKEVIESKLVANTDAQKYELTINSGMAVDGTVTLTETTGLYRVVIEGMDGEWFGKNDPSGIDVKAEGVPAGNYVIDYKDTTPMTPDFGVMTIAKTNLTSANDKLGDTTNTTPKADGTIEVKKAYKVELDTDFVDAVGYVAQKADVATSKTFASGDYLVPGIKVFVKVDAGTKISSTDENVVLALDTSVTVAGKDIYSFVMPEKDVAKTVITKGSAVSVGAPEEGTSAWDGSNKVITATNGTVVVTITSASSTAPVVKWSPYATGDMATDAIGIKGLDAGKPVAADPNPDDDGIYTWTVTITVDGATLDMGASKYMIVTIGDEMIPVKIETAAATKLTAGDITLSAASVTADSLKYGGTLATDAKAYGTNLAAADATAATAGTWTWCAVDATPKKTDAAATTVNKASKYTLWIPVAAAHGYTFTDNEIDWANEAGLKVNSTAGTYNAATGCLVYTFTVDAPTFEFTADTGIVTETTPGEAYGYNTQGTGTAGLTAAVTGSEVASGVTPTYKWTDAQGATIVEDADLCASGTAFDDATDGAQTVTVTAYIGEDAIGSVTITVTVSGNAG